MASSASASFSAGPISVDSPLRTDTATEIVSRFDYNTTNVEVTPATGAIKATPVTKSFEFRTTKAVPKTGVMIVG